MQEGNITLMNKKRIILLGSLVLLSATGFGFWVNRPLPAKINLDLTGTAGLYITGKLVTDGVTENFSGVLPTNIIVKAKCFDYTIGMADAEGTLHATCSVPGERSVSSGTDSHLIDLQGHYSRSWGGKLVSVTSVPNVH